MYLCLIWRKWQKATNGPSCLLCVPSVRWLLFSSTVERLGDSFTVAFSPPGQGQSSGPEATQGQSNRPVCYTFQSNANAAEIQQPSGHLENLESDQLQTFQARATRRLACLNCSWRKSKVKYSEKWNAFIKSKFLWALGSWCAVEVEGASLMSSLPKHYRDLLFMCSDSFNSQVTRGRPLTFSQPARRGAVEKRPHHRPRNKLPCQSERKHIPVKLKEEKKHFHPKESLIIWFFAR